MAGTVVSLDLESGRHSGMFSFSTLLDRYRVAGLKNAKEIVQFQRRVIVSRNDDLRLCLEVFLILLAVLRTAFTDIAQVKISQEITVLTNSDCLEELQPSAIFGAVSGPFP